MEGNHNLSPAPGSERVLTDDAEQPLYIKQEPLYPPFTPNDQQVYHDDEVVQISDDEHEPDVMETTELGSPFSSPARGHDFEYQQYNGDQETGMMDGISNAAHEPNGLFVHSDSPTTEYPAETTAPTAGDLAMRHLEDNGPGGFEDLIFNMQQGFLQGAMSQPSVAHEAHENLQRALSADSREDSVVFSESEDYKKAKRVYERKKNADRLETEDEILFMRAGHEETARVRKLKQDREFDQASADSRLPTDELDGGDQWRPGALLDDDDDEMAPKPPRKRGRASKKVNAGDGDAPPPKRPRKRKAAEMEMDPEDVQDVMAAARGTKGKKAKKPKARKPAAAAQKKKGKKAKGPEMMNIQSLWDADAVKDAQSTAHLPAQPVFKQNNRRADAWRELIASLPADQEGRKSGAMDDKRAVDTAIKQFTGQQSVKPADGGNFSVEGMRATLKPYQILGTGFMRERENASSLPKGGIIADTMGLGKTVMMLANIVNGRPPPKSKSRTTLIVASPALVEQWSNEIRKHCHGRSHKHGVGKVVQHRGGGHRITDNDVQKAMEEADILLTTYNEVARSYPKANVPVEFVTAAQKDAWWSQYCEENYGELHRVKFLRVVLDESQAIANHRSHTSRACRAINAEFRWAMTGTPLINRVEECYPMFKFLGEPATVSLRLFKQNYCTPDDPDGGDRLATMLRKFMLRRTHKTTMFGARILDLPETTNSVVWIQFSNVERQIYEIVKMRFINRINNFARRPGKLDKQYSHIWIMFLRLRMLCSHPLLIQGPILNLLEREDFEKLNQITANEAEESDEGTALLLSLRKQLKNHSKAATIEASENDRNIIDTSREIDTNLLDGDVGEAHGTSFRFRKFLDTMRASGFGRAMDERTLCCKCHERPDDPQITSCRHIFCLECLQDLQHLAAKRGHDTAACAECGEAYTHTEPCPDVYQPEGRDGTMETDSTVEGAEDILDLDAPTGKAKKKPGRKGKGKGKGKGKNRATGDVADWIDMKGNILPSAKTRAIKAQILEWLHDYPGAKIIIYTQFIDMIRVLERVCTTEKWGALTYSGKMSHDARARAIAEFSENPDKKILIASLKCGGLGLNLTMACRCLVVEPYFNNAVEQQAFCRIFRIGQEFETRMVSLVVHNTVDQHMMDIKARKQEEIDELMEGFGKGKVPLAELLRLFSNETRVDEEGNLLPTFTLAAEGEEGVGMGGSFVDEEGEDEGKGWGRRR